MNDVNYDVLDRSMFPMQADKYLLSVIELSGY